MLTMSPKKTDRVLENTIIETDGNGEVTRFEKSSVDLKNEERPQYFIMYTAHLSAMRGLSKRATDILSSILQNRVTWTNEVWLDTVAKNELADEFNTTLQTIKNAVGELVKKDIILMKKVRGGYKYKLNTHLFGRGRFNELEKMKIQITKEFDFKSQYFKESIDITTQYEGLPEPDNINILEKKEIETDKGISRTALIEDISKNGSVVENSEIKETAKNRALDKLRNQAKKKLVIPEALNAQSSIEIREAGERI